MLEQNKTLTVEPRKPLVYWLGSQTNMFYDAIENHKTLKLNNRPPLDEKFRKTETSPKIFVRKRKVQLRIFFGNVAQLKNLDDPLIDVNVMRWTGLLRSGRVLAL